MSGQRPVYSEAPNWEHLRVQVNQSINLLAMCWQATAKQDPALHQQMAHDLYVPALKLLAEFCVCVKETTDEPSEN